METSANLERLGQLFNAGLGDAFLEASLQKIVERQIARDEADLQKVEAVLAEFEHRYGLHSEEFWQLFQAGQAEDTAENMEWNSFYKMRQRILSRLEILLESHQQ